MSGIVTCLVHIALAFVGVIFCMVCVIGVHVPLAMVFAFGQNTSRMLV